MRDALSIFDQVATSSQGHLTYEAAVENLNVLDYDYFFRLIDAFAKGDAPESLLLYKEIRDRGFDSLFFVNSLAQHVRDLMVAADPRTLPLLEMPEDVGQRLVEQARTLPLQWYYAAMRLLNDCDLNYRPSPTLFRLCQLLAPAQPPFDAPDRPVALRNPSESPRATALTPSPQQPQRQDTAPTASAGTPQPAPAPAVKPAVQSPTTPQRHVPATPRPASPKPIPSRPGRPHSFQINSASETTVSSLERKKEDFSDQEFLRAWNDYIVSVPDQKILVSAMRNAIPTRRDNLEFDVLVDHPAQQQAFELAMPKLLRFLRERLRNDFLSVKAIINPEKEIVKFLSPQDFLKKAVSDNAQLGEFLREIEIEIC